VWRKNDGTMLVEWKPYHLVGNKDVVQLDGGYTLYITQLLNDQGSSHTLSKLNFITPIRKIRNQDFELDEREYNELYGSKRSQIESLFADIGTTFKRFHWSSKPKITSLKTYNLQLKLACFLFNVKNAEKLFHLEQKEEHKFWIKDKFDLEHYSEMESRQLSERVEEQRANIEHMVNEQMEYINQLLNGNDTTTEVSARSQESQSNCSNGSEASIDTVSEAPESNMPGPKKSTYRITYKPRSVE
jgi:hypothetical protein